MEREGVFSACVHVLFKVWVHVMVMLDTAFYITCCQSQTMSNWKARPFKSVRK